MELIGEIQDIIYRNEINSYTVATFETDEESTVVVGYLPFVGSGDSIKVEGKFVEHREYGRQFKVDTFEKLLPQTEAAIEKFLANGNIKGIGAATAKKIVKRFGKETLHILRDDPMKLSLISGISTKKAKEIGEEFIQNWEVWQLVGFLDKFGIGAEQAKKVFDLLGANAKEQIEENPYILIDIARGVDFAQIDKMALDLGISYDNDKRISSAVKYALIRSTYNGHACVQKQNLIDYVAQLIDVSSENVEDALINLKAKEEIVIEKRSEKEEYVYLQDFYQVEDEIAFRIKRLQKAKNVKKVNNLSKLLEKVQENSNIELSEKQKEAVNLVNENNVIIITGGPGTGKTTIIKTIIDIYESQGKKLVLTAPTGRAAKKIAETTGREALTLHRLLEIGKIDEEGMYKHNDYEGAPIDADLIIVDEMSMVDMFLMSYLLKCIYQGTKLILVGDVDQLSSVGPGSVLKDLINSGEVVTIHLDKIFRQAAKSKIILNAHRVNNGESFIPKGEKFVDEGTNEDFFFIRENSQEKVLEQVISLCTGRLQKYGNYDFFSSIQVLSPTKKGMLGTKELNKALQQALNPNTQHLPEKASNGAIFRQGDRVMQIKNNYDIYWEKEGEDGQTIAGSGVFNGEIGTITQISEKEKLVEVLFDDQKTAWYEFSELDQIEHSYAITIHKAQRKRI